VCCRYRAAPTLWLLGYSDQALASSQAALALAQQLAHPRSLAIALYWVAMLHHLRREASLTQAHAEAAITIATEQEFPVLSAQGMPLQGWALAVSGQSEEGITYIRQGLATYGATRATRDRPYFLALLAEASAQVGQTTEGIEAVTEALATVAKSAVHWWEAELYRLKGELLLHAEGRQAHAPLRGRSAASHRRRSRGEGGVRHAALTAEECFQQALTIARRQQAKSLELRAAMSLSRLWQHQGKRAEARELLAPVYGWFTEGFDTADLQEARALLEALT
jgi:predicted ATPase